MSLVGAFAPLVLSHNLGIGATGEMVMIERSKEVIERWKQKGLDAFGRLVPSAKPTALALKHRPQPSMFELVREAVRSQRLAEAANSADVDTFEEANDFDVDDDPFPTSRFERPFEEMKPGELTRRRRQAAIDAETKAAEAAKRREERAAEEGRRERRPEREGTERRPEGAPARSQVDYGLEPE